MATETVRASDIKSITEIGRCFVCGCEGTSTIIRRCADCRPKGPWENLDDMMLVDALIYFSKLEELLLISGFSASTTRSSAALVHVAWELQKRLQIRDKRLQAADETLAVCEKYIATGNAESLGNSTYFTVRFPMNTNALGIIRKTRKDIQP